MHTPQYFLHQSQAAKKANKPTLSTLSYAIDCTLEVFKANSVYQDQTALFGAD